MQKKYIWLIVVLACIILLLAIAASNASVSAQPAPGRFETWIANRVKGWAIRRAAARASLPPPPASAADAIRRGRGLFNMECAFCHGHNGLKPSAVGESMYPRVLNLSSPQVQALSNRDLYWVIQNGIRLSGMPGFAQMNSSREIWELVLYTRSFNHPH